MGGIAAVEHQRVPVGIAEEGHMADAGVEDVAVELNALPLELRPRLGNIWNPQRDVGGVRAGELPADIGGVHQVQADVLAELELGPRPASADLLEAEGVAVPR